MSILHKVGILGVESRSHVNVRLQWKREFRLPSIVDVLGFEMLDETNLGS